MWGWLAIKALVSGLIVAAVSEIARRYPTTGALVASLPLVSVLGMLWLWHDRPDRAYPRWMSNNQDCKRLWWSGGGWRC